ncbi:hypothetical protein MYU51_009989 [Penicillium brevicompactum]|uniref:uncharacterized protein n=1 Tax=Penicillium brevicompactum TaxID=5074 RepID=UPI002542245E|nr:uncharacterized protein N7506_009598 [Penicillium brevicompactum]KAJ5326496.1 hypothetical protein N7506_009598 [Penicillium brevicompactum]
MHFTLCLLPVLSLFNQVLGGDVKLPILPKHPSKDDFYKPEGESWKTEPAGTILKTRNVTFASRKPNIPSDAQAYQLLFVTQDVHKEPATTVTTIVVPVNANLNRLVSFQNAYDSADIDCSPSYGFLNQASGVAVTWNQGQISILGDFPLEGGPVLNIPDYEGSNAAFTVGPQTAYHTLDSIRAALNSQHITGLSSEAKTILYGYSGGGFATEWATEYHASYAPALNIIGAAMGGLPTNITNTYLHVNGGKFSELNVLATLGLANAYSNVSDYVDEHILPDYKDPFFYPRVRCGPQACLDRQPSLSNVNISLLYDNGDAVLHHFDELLAEIGVMGQQIREDNRPHFPLYIWAGTNDDVVRPVTDIIALVRKFKRAGTKVTFIPKLGQGHVTALVTGSGAARRWINKQFETAEKLAQFGGILEEDKEDLLVDVTEEDDFADSSTFRSQQILDSERDAREHDFEL